jgi:uncharacterized Zn finger protein
MRKSKKTEKKNVKELGKLLRVFSASEFCPKCGCLQNARVEMVKNEEKDIFIRSYHCEACDTFIRNEEIDPDLIIKFKTQI